MFIGLRPWTRHLTAPWFFRRHSHRGLRTRCLPLWLEQLEARTLLNAGDLDPTFGTGGKVLTDFTGPLDAFAAATVIQPDGKIVVAGTGLLGDLPYGDFLMARYNPDGSLDPAFGNSGRVNTEFFGYGQSAVKGLAVGPDGKIVVVGEHQGSSANLLFGVARYTANGGLDQTFGSGGTVATVAGVPTGVAIQPDNKIIVVGNVMQTPSAVAAAVVVRFNSDGSLDPTFGTGGEILSPNISVASVVLQIDGKIIVAGSAVERFNPDGSSDTGFATSALTTLRATATGVLLQGDGKIMATASSGGFLGQPPTPLLARLNSNGTLDTTFGSNGQVVAAVSSSGLALQPDGKIIVAGAVPQPYGTSSSPYEVARYNPNGSVDATFGTSGTATILVVPAAIAIGADGKTVVVGVAAGSSSTPMHIDFVMLRLGLSGAIDTGFGAGGQVATGFIGTVDSAASAVAVQADGKIIVAGNAGEKLAVTRYSPNGSLDASFGSGGRVTTDVGVSPPFTSLRFVGVALQADGKILVGGAGVGGGALVRYSPDGSLDPTFGTAGIVTSVVGLFSVGPLIQPDGKILVLGGNGGPLTRLNADGSMDGSFGTGGKLQVFGGGGIALQPDRKILIDANSNGSVELTRYNPDGSPDASFGANGVVMISGATSGIAVQPDSKIIIGTARFNPDGSVDPFFGMNGRAVYVTVGTRVILAPDGDIIEGGVGGIVVYKPNGTLDVRFGNAGLITPDFAPGDLTLQPDGSIVLAGTTTASGHTTLTVARYVATGGSSLTPNQLFIAQVYPDLLQRAVDPSGLAFWSGQLDRGSSRTQVVQVMQTSPEYHTVVVRGLYRRILGRFPDASGSAAWVDFLNRGGTAEQLEAFLFGSDEFFVAHGSDNSQGFLPALYQIVLHRPIDPSGAESWAQALAAGTSRTAVAAAILASLESDRLETQMLYAELLHRPPDPSGFDTFTNLLQQGASNEEAIAIIISSDEYFAQV